MKAVISLCPSQATRRKALETHALPGTYLDDAYVSLPSHPPKGIGDMASRISTITGKMVPPKPPAERHWRQLALTLVILFFSCSPSQATRRKALETA